MTARTPRMTIAAGHEVAAMPSGPGERYDFFLSRRGSVATIAQEVTDVLTEKGYRVFVQDYSWLSSALSHEPCLTSSVS